ncbi:hypothetical protein [Arthrobacter sp. SD76]|uniref:hypothetical protein n=1 Tax=Arthrobacter sp. SD76 TaxID=3415007 RepID=UPI003C75A01E
MTRVGEAGQPAPLIRGVGGVFGSSILAAEFIDAVIAALPRADVAIGRGDPLDGAETLLNVTAQSALSPHLARATAASPLLAR